MNKKILNWSIVISLLTAYMFPGTSSDGFEYGYPFKFFTTYNSPMNIGDTIFYSTAFNLLGFGMNIVVIYYIIYIIYNFINKMITR
jgi:hypothetical protein